MKTIIFMWYLMIGTIVPQKEVDGRMTYRVEFNSLTEITEGNQTFIGTNVDYAYKGEILQWIKTNEFKYNEEL
jgi:hypothetical protein